MPRGKLEGKDERKKDRVRSLRVCSVAIRNFLNMRLLRALTGVN